MVSSSSLRPGYGRFCCYYSSSRDHRLVGPTYVRSIQDRAGLHEGRTLVGLKQSSGSHDCKDLVAALLLACESFIAHEHEALCFHFAMGPAHYAPAYA